MAHVTPADVQELNKLISTTEFIAAAGNRLMNAAPLSTGHTIYYYVVPKGKPMGMFAAHDQIEESSLWAIIHDYFQDRYELWVDGVKFENLQDYELIPELSRCIADKSFR